MMGRGLLPRQRALSGPRLLPLVPQLLWPYPALAFLSKRYSSPGGALPTCYSPVRRSLRAETLRSLDLHVLGAPPAFVLSQDQTLQLNLIPVFAFKTSSQRSRTPQSFTCVRIWLADLLFRLQGALPVPDQLPALSKTGGLLRASTPTVNKFFCPNSLFFSPPLHLLKPHETSRKSLRRQGEKLPHRHLSASDRRPFQTASPSDGDVCEERCLKKNVRVPLTPSQSKALGAVVVPEERKCLFLHRRHFESL